MNLFEDCLNDNELKEKYKTLAKMYHPDNGGTTAQMQEINNQYKVAKDNIIYGNKTNIDKLNNGHTNNDFKASYQDLYDFLNKKNEDSHEHEHSYEIKVPFYLYPFYLFFSLTPRIFFIVLPSIFILIFFFSDYISHSLKEFVYYLLKIKQ